MNNCVCRLDLCSCLSTDTKMQNSGSESSRLSRCRRELRVAFRVSLNDLSSWTTSYETQVQCLHLFDWFYYPHSFLYIIIWIFGYLQTNTLIVMITLCATEAVVQHIVFGHVRLCVCVSAQ